MRVSDAQVFLRAQRNTTNARARFVHASDRLATGYRVIHPGDDPSALARAGDQQGAIARLSTIEKNLEHKAAEMNVMDSALGGVVEHLTRARELAVQMANDTFSASDRQNAAAEIQALEGAMTSALNTQFGERYVFAGHQTDAVPFDAIGNYAGDSGRTVIELSPGVTTTTNIDPAVAIKGAAGGVDLYQVMADLRAALNANDAAQIRGRLDEIDAGLEQVTVARAELGGNTRVMELARVAHLRVIDEATAQKSALIEQDFIEGSTALAEAENALQAVIGASAKTFDLSLLDRL